MIYKIIKNDLLKKKLIMTAVFIFIMLSALLIAGGSRMLIDLNNSIEALFEKSSTAHFIQSHSGDLNQEEILAWSRNNEKVKSSHIAEMINIDGSKLFFNDGRSQSDTVMDLNFVKQNQDFDFLLNLNNQQIKVNDGEIAVPIYYLQRLDLKLGDSLKIENGRSQYNFKITSFVRDVQMNPSIISSKRFVVSAADFEKLKPLGESEYQIAFQLNDLKQLQQFRDQYSRTDLPKKGPTIDFELLKMANAVTDGLIAAVIILISLLLNLIALLCLRFVILLTLEEDYREIGVMKAIGIKSKKIKKIYFYKYLFTALTASIFGYFLSLALSRIFAKNIALYIGRAPESLGQFLIPLLAAITVALMVIIFSLIVLRRFKKISAVEAIRMGSRGDLNLNSSRFSLFKNKYLNSSVFLGFRDVILRYRLYAVLFIVFILSTFIIIVPVNFLNTIQSEDFISYMGVGKSDIIIDIRQSENIEGRFEEIINYLKDDAEVEKFSPYITSQYEVINQEGEAENLMIETGDFSIFQLDYLEGGAPLLDNEIALSYLIADQFNKKVGDKIVVIINGVSRQMLITGIYQDITDGGKTAKANIEADLSSAAWYTINLDISGNRSEKIAEYKQNFEDLKITDPEEYFQQTFKNTIDQLKLLTFGSLLIVIIITILITSLFIKMLTAKDRSQIAIKKAVGISLKNIRLEYLTKALFVLNFGIILGTITANTLGEKMVSAALTIVGAAEISFKISVLQSYIMIPLLLMVTVSLTVVWSLKSIKNLSIADINLE
ncbi:MAG: FtsX-like permease family protein [Bacillota bacterium]